MGRIAKVKRRFVGWSRRLRRAARWLAGSCAATITTVAFFVPKDLGSVPVAAWLATGASVGVLVAIPLWLAGVFAGFGWGRASELSVLPGAQERAREGAVGADASGPALKVTQGTRERLVPGADIASGVVLPSDWGVELLLRLANEVELSLRLRHSDHGGDATKVAEELCAALGLDAGRQRTELRWTSRGAALMAGFATLSASSMALMAVVATLKDTPLQMAATFAFLFLPYFVTAAVVRAFRHEVEVGQDGVRWKRFLRTRHVDFARLERLEAVQERFDTGQAGRRLLVFHRRDATPLTLRVESAALFNALAARVEAARERYQQTSGSMDAPFRRAADASLETWAQELQQALAHEGSFRQATLRREDALHVVEDPRAHPEARVGAALALRQHGTATDRLRVRVAAEGTVHPKLRVALTHALAGEVEEEEIEAAAQEVQARQATATSTSS